MLREKGDTILGGKNLFSESIVTCPKIFGLQKWEVKQFMSHTDSLLHRSVSSEERAGPIHFKAGNKNGICCCL